MERSMSSSLSAESSEIAMMASARLLNAKMEIATKSQSIGLMDMPRTPGLIEEDIHPITMQTKLIRAEQCKMFRPICISVWEIWNEVLQTWKDKWRTDLEKCRKVWMIWSIRELAEARAKQSRTPHHLKNKGGTMAKFISNNLNKVPISNAAMVFARA